MEWIIGVILAVIALIIIIIIGGVLSGNKGDSKTDCYRLYLHLQNTAEVSKDYQDSIKSSKLRAYGASLYGILTDTNKQLTEFLVEKYNFKEKDIAKDVVEEATLEKDGLESELFEAKINGNLDRIYTHKMTYEISMIMTEENRVMKTVKNDLLVERLTKSYDSLDTLYNSFNDYSETK